MLHVTAGRCAVVAQAALLGYMVSSFFANDAYQWYVYYLVAYAICLRRIYESTTGKVVVITKASRPASEDVTHSLTDYADRVVPT